MEVNILLDSLHLYFLFVFIYPSLEHDKFANQIQGKNFLNLNISASL